MSVLTKEDLLNKLRETIGDDTTDKALGLLEDVSDTIDSLSTADTEDWKQKYEQNDAAWRQRYKDRFFGGTDEDPPPPIEETKPVEIPNNPKTFDELFTVKEM